MEDLNTSIFADVKCPICNSIYIEAFKKCITYDYNLIKCKDCKVIFADPFKAPENDFYSNAKDISSSERHTKLYPFRKSHPARQIAELKKGEGKKLLDVGCGNGAFLSYVSDNDFECWGIDLDELSLAQVRKRSLKNTVVSNLTLEEFAGSTIHHHSFDIITMFEVFEHLENPNRTIELIKLLLKPEGTFIGSLPNIDRPFMWRLNMDYELPPYHLTYWNINSWTKYLNINGFKIEFAENTNYYGFLCDVICERINSSLKLKVFQVINSLVWRSIKKFIETPVEANFKLGAGFVFVSKINSIVKTATYD